MKVAELEEDGLHIQTAEHKFVVGLDEAGTVLELEKLADRLNRFAIEADGLARELKVRGLSLNPADDIELFVGRHLVKTREYWQHLFNTAQDKGRPAGELPEEMVLRFALKAHGMTELGRLTGIYYKMLPDKGGATTKEKRPLIPRLNVYTSFSVVMAFMCAGRAIQMYVTGEPFL